MRQRIRWSPSPEPRLLLVLALVSVLAGILFFGARVGADLWLGSLRLSTEEDTCAAEPRSAASADGNWLATTWIRRTSVSGGCTTGGAAVIRWATETGDMPDWSPEVELPLPLGACAIHADTAVTDTTAHVIVSYWTPCNASDASSGINHYTCAMDGGGCSLSEVAVTQPGSANLRLSDARIALDTEGRPHIAYARGTHGLAAGDILYTRWTGTAWSSPVIVSTGDKIDGFYRPAIAAAGGRIHIVWERHRNDDLRARGDVQYRYCTAGTGQCQSGLPLSFVYPVALLEPAYPTPAVAAHGDRIVIVWTVCADVDTNAPCSSFYLLYARSDNGGTSWSQPREVGTETAIGQLNLSTRLYAGNDNGLDPTLASEYAASTRPQVVLGEGALPIVAWQVGTGESYVITSTRAVTETTGSFTWATESPPAIGRGDDASIAASIVAANAALDPEGIHFVYMRARLEQVGSEKVSRAQVYYDYRGPRMLTVVAGSTTDGPRPLPQERGITIGTRVVDSIGSPVSGVDVTLATDFGSFDYGGTGSQLTRGVSDASGWMSVTLYSNLPGSAGITAWLDTTRNDVLDAWETYVLMTRTWQTVVSPAVSVGAVRVLAGDLLTATLTGHPYSTPERDGWPSYYVLWWCPRPDAADVSAEVAGPWAMEIASWSRSTVLRVPEAASGSYTLASYLTADAGGGDPCSEATPTAASTDIETLDSPPPGEPWILAADDRPAPGASLIVTLTNHTDGTYTLWWCPATAESAQVQAALALVTIADADPYGTQVEVPLGSEGLYRLESHRPLGTCARADTREGASGLLQPISRVFLPLTLRSARR